MIAPGDPVVIMTAHTKRSFIHNKTLQPVCQVNMAMDWKFIAIPYEEWEKWIVYDLTPDDGKKYDIDFHIRSWRDLVEYPFWDNFIDVTYSQSCQQMPYDEACWNLDLPKPPQRDNHAIVLDMTDYMSVAEDHVPELLKIEDYYGERANQVVVLHWEKDISPVYTGPLNTVYFPMHSYELFTRLAESYNEWKDSITLDPRPMKMQCLNGIAKDHRVQVVNLVQHMPDSIISLADRIPLESAPYSDYTECDNYTNWFRLLDVYGSASVNIVVETKYYTPGIITEKTLFAFLALQVPLVIGHKHIVQELRDLGFDMFDDIVDNSYDDMDNSLRLSQAIFLNHDRIIAGIDRTAIADRLLQNQHHLMHTWMNKLTDDLSSSIQDILQANFPTKR